MKPIHQSSENHHAPAHKDSALSSVSAIFRAFVSAVVPEAATLDSRSWVELESLVDETLRDRPADMRRQLRLFLHVIEWLPLLRYGGRFTALSATRRAQVLGYLQDHRFQLIRTGFWGLRTLAFLGYYGRAEATHEIGYGADRRGWEALP